MQLLRTQAPHLELPTNIHTLYLACLVVESPRMLPSPSSYFCVLSTKLELLYYPPHLAWAPTHHSPSLHSSTHAVPSDIAPEYFFVHLPPMCYAQELRWGAQDSSAQSEIFGCLYVLSTAQTIMPCTQSAYQSGHLGTSSAQHLPLVCPTLPHLNLYRSTSCLNPMLQVLDLCPPILLICTVLED